MYNNTNYRPLTVLNAAAKLFESLLSKQITEKIDTHLHDELSAYRKTHSSETNVIRITEQWITYLFPKVYVLLDQRSKIKKKETLGETILK